MASSIKTKKNKTYTLVFGLTADPIHKGHEQVILNSYTFAAENGFKIAEFLLVPSYQPNLIADKKQPGTAFKHRFAMCELIANQLKNKFNYQVHVSDIEKILFEKNQQKSYSFNTLETLNKPNQLFVLSADHFAGRWPKFRKWHHWQQLIKKFGLFIHQRPGHSINQSFIKQLKDINSDVFVVKNYPSIKTSSTWLRHQLAKNIQPTQKQLNPQTLQYIVDNSLYQN